MTEALSGAGETGPKPGGSGGVDPGATGSVRSAPRAAEEKPPFNLSSWTLQHQPLVIFLLVLLTLFGIVSYGRLAQSEDPPFTFKVMVIRTLWPGATARQVQEEVTDRIARKLQETPDVDFLRSYSRPGESTLFFTIKDAAPPSAGAGDLVSGPQRKWATSPIRCRRRSKGRISTMSSATCTRISTRFEGDGFSPAQLHDYAERLRTELLARARTSTRSISSRIRSSACMCEIANAAAREARTDAAADRRCGRTRRMRSPAAGVFTTADDRVYVRPSGQLQECREAWRHAAPGQRPHDPARRHRHHRARLYGPARPRPCASAGRTCSGIGVTMAPTADVIALGKELDAETARLRASLPAGLKLESGGEHAAGGGSLGR